MNSSFEYESSEEELEETLNEYNDQFLTTEEVIEELRNYADELQQEDRRKERLGLSAEELAFYDARATNTETEIEDELLQEIAQEVCKLLRENVNIDWTNRKAMRSKLKTRVKGVLRKNGLCHSAYNLLVEPIAHQAEALYGDISTVSHSSVSESSIEDLPTIALRSANIYPIRVLEWSNGIDRFNHR